jgi:hypothetical protein
MSQKKLKQQTYFEKFRKTEATAVGFVCVRDPKLDCLWSKLSIDSHKFKIKCDQNYKRRQRSFFVKFPNLIAGLGLRGSRIVIFCFLFDQATTKCSAKLKRKSFLYCILFILFSYINWIIICRT